MNMSLKSQLYCVWSFIFAGPLIGLTLWLSAGFVPPPAPSMSADAIADFYLTHSGGIRWAVIASVLLWTFWLPLSAAVSARMATMEKGFPIWALIQFGGGISMMLIVEFGGLLWGVASYRADRSPEIVQALNDIGWFIFMMPVGPLAVQIASTGIAALHRGVENPSFPRWFGFMSLWLATATLPGILLVLFQTGPFAWNGLFAFWIPVGAFGGWIVVLIVLMLKAIQRDLAASNAAAR